MAIPRCISTLGLRPSDIEHLQSGQMLEDTHMMAAQNLIQQQFPQLLGCQSTLLCQNKQFVPVNGNGNGKFEILARTHDTGAYMFVPKAIQILYNGHYHWVTVVCTEGKLYLCDSLASDKLTQTLEESIRVLFQNTSEDNVVTIHRLPVQQQKKGSMNCGIYAIAYAFYTANGDDLCLLSFEEEQMRTHLLQCYEVQCLKPFPITSDKVVRCRGKKMLVNLLNAN